MLPLHMLTETATVVTRTKTDVDAYGNDLFSPTETPLRCYVQPRRTSEGAPDRPQVTVGLTLYTHADAPITPSSAVTVRGKRYEVDGAVEMFQFGSTSYLSVALTRVTG